MNLEIYKNGSLIKTPTYISWSGERNKVSRVLSFEYISGEACVTGDKITFFIDGVMSFVGQVVFIDFSTDGKNISVKCFDAVYNLVKSEATGRFGGTLTDIAGQVCKIFGLDNKVIGASKQIEIVSTGDLTYYDVIHKAAKTEFGDKKFNISMQGQKSVVLESQDDDTVATLSTAVNIRQAKYSESIEDMVNRISIVTSDGVVVETKENATDVQKYGIFQSIERQKEDDNKQNIELVGVEYTGDLLVNGDIKLLTGRKITIKEPTTNIIGDFFINSDNHVWQDGDYYTQLGIDYVK